MQSSINVPSALAKMGLAFVIFITALLVVGLMITGSFDDSTEITSMDSKGKTLLGESGADGGNHPDGLIDCGDHDGDGYCAVAPCCFSKDPSRKVADLKGGDCDDNPYDGSQFILPCTNGPDTCTFLTDGSWGNNPEVEEFVGDNYDNNCNGKVDDLSEVAEYKPYYPEADPILVYDGDAQCEVFPCTQSPEKLVEDCDDGDPCTEFDFVNENGDCVGGLEKQCPNDGDPCTIDVCNPFDGGCHYAMISCDDNNECTVDYCSGSLPNPCTNTPRDNNSSCDNGKGICVSGACLVKG